MISKSVLVTSTTRKPEWSTVVACQGQEVMYYFDESINDCRPFWFSGCGGNQNRFTDHTECRQRCLRDVGPVATPGVNVRTATGFTL
jgi:hypothetical protein